MNTPTVTTDATSPPKRRGRPRSDNINRLIRITPPDDDAIREIGSGSLTTGVMRLLAAWKARVDPAPVNPPEVSKLLPHKYCVGSVIM